MAEQFSKGAQERCSHWVKNINHSLNENNVKRKLEIEPEDIIETDSEFDSVSECGGSKRRKIGVQLKAEKLELFCEWKDCNFTCKSVDQFVRHVANHVTELAIEEESGSEVYACLWAGCIYKSGIDKDIVRHVNYHAFHSKLKSIGVNVRSRTKLPVIYITLHKNIQIEFFLSYSVLCDFRNVNVTKIGKIF